MTGDSATFADALHFGRFSTAWLWIGPSLDRRTTKSKVMAFLWCNSLRTAMRKKHESLTGEGLLTQMAIVPQNFDAGTLLLRLMEWLLTQGPLMRRNLTQGGFWRSSLFAWHLTHFLCMAFDADWNGCHLTQINFTCQLTQTEVLGGIWRKLKY